MQSTQNNLKPPALLPPTRQVGIMVYSSTGSEEWTKYYTGGCTDFCSQWNCPLPACVPASDMVLGIEGSAAAGEIVKICDDVKAKKFGGVMVWYVSLLDAATGAIGLEYGNMDASHNKYDAWAQALQLMQS